MNQYKTQAIVLGRVNYLESDRIVTFMSKDYGKLRLMAKGTRLLKSKLAGGIELFAQNEISFIRGRGEIGTLISARLKTNYAKNIVSDIERVQLGYELLKLINRVTEDEAESEYFYLLKGALSGLDNPAIDLKSNQLWFLAQLIRISGHNPILDSARNQEKFSEKSRYGFDHEAMAFFSQKGGRYSPKQVKYLRLVFNAPSPATLIRVEGADKLSKDLLPLVTTIRQAHLNI